MEITSGECKKTVVFYELSIHGKNPLFKNLKIKYGVVTLNLSSLQ